MSARVGTEISNVVAQQKRSFTIGLFEVGKCTSCMFSFCCTPCAIAQARSALDGSNGWFNMCFVPAPVVRWFIRSAYGIDGSASSDILTTCCFTPCAANQMYQTAVALGPPTTDSGHRYNNQNWRTRTDEGCLTTMKNCCYATFCPHCATAAALQTAFDMPFWFGLCCMNPCVATNFIRYQYRISGEDLCEDCVSVACWPFTINAIMKLLTESDKMAKQQGWPKQYLASNPSGGNNNGVAPTAAVNYPTTATVAPTGVPQAQIVVSEYKPQPVYDTPASVPIVQPYPQPYTLPVFSQPITAAPMVQPSYPQPVAVLPMAVVSPPMQMYPTPIPIQASTTNGHTTLKYEYQSN